MTAINLAMASLDPDESLAGSPLQRLSKPPAGGSSLRPRSAATRDGQVGRKLAGRYRLEALLGRGAMGEVYQAYDLRRRQLCAIKLVLAGAGYNLQAHRRFFVEADVVARLFHPNIVEVYEFSADADGTHFLVMELLKGHDLFDVLRAETRLPLARALPILQGAAAGLQYAHDLGVVHRDITPSNVFVCEQRAGGNEAEAVKILDFGLAKLDPEADHKSAPQLSQGLIVGTPAYLAPEATLAGSGFIDARADQWSLAVLAYQMLSGRQPFSHQNPYELCALIRREQPVPLQQLVPSLPTHVCAAIAVAMNKDRELRFDSVKEFIRALSSPTPRAVTAPSNGRAHGAAESPGMSPQKSSQSTPSAPRGTGMPARSSRTVRDSVPEFVIPENQQLSRVSVEVENKASPPLSRPAHSERKTVQYSEEEMLALARMEGPSDELPATDPNEAPTRRFELAQLAASIAEVAERTVVAERTRAEAPAPRRVERPKGPPPIPQRTLPIRPAADSQPRARRISPMLGSARSPASPLSPLPDWGPLPSSSGTMESLAGYSGAPAVRTDTVVAGDFTGNQALWQLSVPPVLTWMPGTLVPQPPRTASWRKALLWSAGTVCMVLLGWLALYGMVLRRHVHFATPMTAMAQAAAKAGPLAQSEPAPAR